MGLWQNLVVGYDENPELWKFYPLSATKVTNKSNEIAVILISAKGLFINSRMIPKKADPAQEFLIPVSQMSMSRTSTAIRPHPLFDQRRYVLPQWDEKKKKQNISPMVKKYREELKQFSESPFSTDKIRAVYNYISSGRDFNKDLCNGVKDKTLILFSVQIPGDPILNLWEDPAVFKAWENYYTSSMTADEKNLDFITGDSQLNAVSHPKKILSSKDASNAKLISANDTTNFTFRGLFREASQVVTVGYESSQKAHQFLRYLIASQGILCGGQAIIPFSIHSKGKPQPKPPVDDMSIGDWADDEQETDADAILNLQARTGRDYAMSIRKALAGYELDNQWKSHAKSAIVILEAATQGRLSITFYREFSSANYMEHVQLWHEVCKWPLWRKKGDGAEFYYGAPSIDKIIQAVFGWPKRKSDKAYERIRMRARQNLIRTIFDNAVLPADYLANAVRRVSNPLAITKDGKFDRKRFSSVLATTCAILKHHYHYTNTKESFDMSIDLSRTDRDYLYGRLLGAADKLEEYALHKKDNGRLVTAAIRYMQTFSMRPATTWQIIHNQLIPYKQQIKNCIEDQELQSIYTLLAVDVSMDDSPLSGLYLAGYYHERAYIEALRSELRLKRREQDFSNNQ